MRKGRKNKLTLKKKSKFKKEIEKIIKIDKAWLKQSNK